MIIGFWICIVWTLYEAGVVVREAGWIRERARQVNSGSVETGRRTRLHWASALSVTVGVTPHRRAGVEASLQRHHCRSCSSSSATRPVVQSTSDQSVSQSVCQSWVTNLYVYVLLSATLLSLLRIRYCKLCLLVSQIRN